MKIADLLAPGSVVCGAQATSKKRALELVAELIASADGSLTPKEVFDGLIARERLGSTGLGAGVAIPHGRLKTSVKTIGVFVHLLRPIDYDALDSKPVDMLFGLAVPEESTEEHLQVLATLAEMFSDPDFCARLRDTPDAARVHALLTRD